MREGLEEVVTRVPDPRRVIEATIRRLDDQLARARRLYQFDEDTWEAFLAKRAGFAADRRRRASQQA